MKQMNVIDEKNEQVIEGKYNYIFKSNGLEREIDSFKESRLKDIKFTMVTKHIMFSLFALI
ncbi:MAG: hypothetical protein ACM3MI_12490, partial [Clostridiales bacterium]